MQTILLTIIIGFLVGCASPLKSSKPPIAELPNTQSLTKKDLDPLRKHIGNKSVVMLGETIHITNEFSKARSALIQNLHEQGSFNILLFEGSPIEFWIAQDKYLSSKRDDQAVADFQRTALFGLWQTSEIRSLLSYSLKTQSTKKSSPLYISSYDVQIGQGRFFASGERQVLPEFIKHLKKVTGKLTKTEEKKLLSLENLVSCKRKKYPTSVSDYESGISAIQLLKDKIEKNNSTPQMITHSRFLSFIPESLKFSLEFCKEINSSKRNYTETRDEWAARQFQAILDKTHEKVIVWAHSGHVRQGPNKDGRMSFGAYMRQTSPHDIFSISFTAKEGSIISFVDETGNETEPTEKVLLPVEKTSLENKLSQLSERDFFYLSRESDGYFNIQEIGRTENFIEPLHPYKDFDGFYFIQKVSAPRLLLP